jgi:HEAT repeat protein
LLAFQAQSAQGSFMGKRGRILIAMMAVVVVGAMAWAFFAARSAPPEPVYRGKPLSYWLQGYTSAAVFTNVPSQMEAYEAVHDAGTNAIPLLLQMLQTENSQAKITLVLWAFSIPYVKHHYSWPLNKSYLGLQGFSALGMNATPAIPDLIKILNENSNSITVEYAERILGGLGSAPAAADAVPALLRIASRTNGEEATFAIQTLSQIHPRVDAVVPVLVKALHDPRAPIRANVAFGLGLFGHDAKPAVPELVAILSEPVPGSNSVPAIPGHLMSVRSAAEIALRAIDPETFARVVTNSTLLTHTNVPNPAAE